jgi:hypothetical protein
MGYRSCETVATFARAARMAGRRPPRAPMTRAKTLPAARRRDDHDPVGARDVDV